MFAKKITFIMENSVKKIASYILIFVVLISTLLGIFSVWELISLEDVMWKIMKTLFIVFVSALVVLFIYSVLLRDSSKKKFQD